MVSFKFEGKRLADVCDLNDVSSPIEESSGKKTVKSVPEIETNSIPIYRICASDILWKVRGSSEISKFVKRFLDGGGCVRYVDCLPQSYNGDTIFKLPPVAWVPKRGAGLKHMD